MNQNSKITGIFLLLLYVCVTTALLNDAFIKPFNLQNLVRYISLFGIIGIGAVFVIITGGIDLSIGSLVGLTGCVMTLTINQWMDQGAAANLGFLLRLVGAELVLLGVAGVAWSIYRTRGRQPPPGRRTWVTAGISLAVGALLWIAAGAVRGLQLPAGWTIPVCLVLVMLLAIHLGWLHGILITKLKLQPFVVTLCGLMCYRGLSRWLADDKPIGFGTTYDDSLRLLAIGKPCTATFVLLAGGIVVALLAVGRWLWKLRTGERSDWVSLGTWLVIGAAMIAIGSSKYWDGWQTEYDEPLAQLGAWDVQTFAIEVPEAAEDRPAQLMRWAVYPFALSAVLLVIASTRRFWGAGDRRGWLRYVLLPLGLCILGGIAIALCKRWIGDRPVNLTGWKSDQVARFLAVCGAMALTMSGVFWLISPISRRGTVWEKSLLALTAVSAVFWLLGQTTIHETTIQVPFFIMLVVAVLAGVFLRQTIYGRYLFALGRNEEATRYSGINTDRMIILAYVACAACAGLGGILFTLASNNVEPSGHGSFYELYAIAAAVLGGCSLRGGEGSVVGMILGAAIMRVLFNAPNMIGVAQQLELFTMGIVILLGVITDEQIRRAATRRNRTLRVE